MGQMMTNIKKKGKKEVYKIISQDLVSALLLLYNMYVNNNELQLTTDP